MKFSRVNLFALTVVLFTSAVTAQTVEENAASDLKSIAPSAVFAGTGAGPIPDAAGTGPANWGTPRTVSFHTSGLVGFVTNIVLTVTMSHSFVGDLEMVLTGPGGQAPHVIFSRVGAITADSLGDSSNLNGTYTFTDFATANPWTVATTDCGSSCVITPQAYRATIAGPTGNPAAVTSLRSRYAGILFLNGEWTLRIRDGAGGDTGSVTAATLRIETALTKAPFDFDGDDKTDIGIFRPGPGEWWINRSGDGQTIALQFGSSTDKMVPADYTGDGQTDIAIFRPTTGEWYVLRSEDFSFFSVPFGTNGDIPTPADFDTDTRADFALFRPSTGIWYITQSLGGPPIIHRFGVNGDIPVVGDYDADQRADIAIFRPAAGGAQWWIQRSTAGLLALQFGADTDTPVQADFTGDAKTDVAVWRPSTGEWFVIRSQDSTFYSFPFGTNGDLPVPGDYDGDRFTDAAVFRPSSATWYVARSTAGTQIVQFGVNGDRPIANALVP